MLKQRASNMELLRIIAMLLVLVVHSNFRSIHAPTFNEIIDSPIVSYSRFFLQALSVVCVNVFILISGWFGIHPRKDKFFSLLFQVLFFSIIGYVVSDVFFPSDSKSYIGRIFDIWYTPNYWFIRAYIILYVLAPILNTYCEKTNSRQLLETIIITYLCNVSFGWYFASCAWYSNGYSPLAFMGLYLIARYLRLYPLNVSPLKNFVVYVGCSLLLAGLAFILGGAKINSDGTLFSYNSPFVMISSIALFLSFVKLNFTSKIVNKIAVSCFAVYLFHSHPALFDLVYCNYFKQVFMSNSYSNFLIIQFGVVLSFFIIAVIFDQLRLVIWKVFVYNIKNEDEKKRS